MPFLRDIKYLLLLLCNPLVDGLRLAAEVHSYLYHLAAVGLEGRGVALLVDLAHGFFGRAVELELHDIYVLARLQHQVNAAAGGVVFHVYVEAHQSEDDEEHVLVVNLQVALHLVGYVGVESGEAG